MAKIETTVQTQSSHTLHLEANKLTLTAVKEVLSATDKTILAKLTDRQIVVCGRDLRVHKLNLEQAHLEIDGIVESFKYQANAGGKGFLKRILK